MRPWKRAGLWIFAAALLCSLLAHGSSFIALGVLAALDALNREVPEEPIEITLSDSTEEPIAPETAPDEPITTVDRSRARADEQPEREVPPRERERPRSEPPPRERQQTEPPRTHDRPLAVTQRSADPTVEPPPNARFIARENSRVEEETVATERNQVVDDANPQAAREESTAEGEGSSAEQETGGTETGEAERERGDTAEAPSTPSTQSPTPAPSPREARPAEPQPAERAETPAPAPTPRESSNLIIADRYGSFTVPAPSASQSDSVLRDRPLTAEELRRRIRDHGRHGVNWSTAVATYGQEALDNERAGYERSRRARNRGSNNEQRWAEFRAAIENYVPGVRSGNQTALNAAANPFAEYLSEVHRRLHREFADGFLAGLPIAGGPYSDMSLRTELEIVFNRAGSIHRIGIVETSGYLPYDFAAFNAVMSAQPYPRAPEDILSPDGRVYVHWAFYRNERQCGTFNAEPYILREAPPETPRDRGGPPAAPPPPADEVGAVVPGAPRVRVARVKAS